MTIDELAAEVHRKNCIDGTHDDACIAISGMRESLAKIDRLCSRYERNRDPLLSVSEVRRALGDPERCGFTGTAAEHRAMGCCESIHGETWRHV